MASTANTPHRTRPTAPRWARALIWVLFGLVAVAALAPDHTAARDQHQAAATAVVAAEDDADLGGTPFAPLDPTAATAPDADMPSRVAAPEDQALQQRINDRMNYLPAWRWDGVSVDARTGGWFGDLKAMPTNAVGIMFEIANFLWQLLLSLLKFGLTVDFVRPAAQAINNGAANIAGKLWYFVPLIWAGVLVKVIRMWMSGKTGKVGRTVVAFIVGTGMLFSIGTSAQDAQQSGVDPYEARGTIPWVAAEGNRLLDIASGALAGTSGSFGISNDDVTAAEAQQGPFPNCAQYIDHLYREYDQLESQAGAAQAHGALKTVSRLWETTFMNNWTRAEFGSTGSGTGTTDLGARVGCKVLEEKAGISPYESAAIATAAHGRDIAPLVFAQTKEENIRRTVVAWAACAYEGDGYRAVDDFKNLDGVGDFAGKANDPKTCKFHIQDGLDTHDPDPDTFDLPDSEIESSIDAPILEVAQAGTTGSAVELETARLQNARLFASSYNGDNLGGRILQGVLAMLTAFIFFIALGFAALGLVAAQFMLIILLMLLPVTVVLMGLGKPGGTKLAKLTGTTLATKFMFGLLLTFLTEVTALGQNVIGGFAGTGGQSIFEQILYALTPLIALFTLKKILSAVGMADVTTMAGGLQFATSAALKATRDPGLDRMGSGDRLLTGNLARRGKNAAAAEASLKKGESLNRWQKLDKRMSRTGNTSLFSAEAAVAGAKAVATGAGAVAAGAGIAAAGAGKLAGVVGLGGALDAANTKVDSAVTSGRSKLTAFGTAARGRVPGRVSAVAAAVSAGAIGAAKTAPFAAVAGTVAAVAGAPLLPAAAAVALLGAGSTAAAAYAARDGKIPQIAGETVTAKVTPDSVMNDQKLLVSTLGSQTLPASKLRANADVELEHTIRNLGLRHFGADPVGFIHQGEKFEFQHAFAEATGIPASLVTVGATGLLSAQPLTRKTLDLGKHGQVDVPVDTDKLSVDAAALPTLWLPAEDAKRLEIDGRFENDDEYAARILAITRARGGLNSDGSYNDAFVMLAGLDRDNDADRKAIEAFLADPASSPELAKTLVLTQKDPKVEQRLVEAARRHVDSQAHVIAVATTENSVRLEQIIDQTHDDNAAHLAKLSRAVDEIPQLINSFVAVRGRRDMTDDRDRAAELLRAEQEILDKLEEKLGDAVESLSGSHEARLAQQLAAESATMENSEAIAALTSRAAAEMDEVAERIEEIARRYDRMWSQDSNVSREAAEELQRELVREVTQASAQFNAAEDEWRRTAAELKRREAESEAANARWHGDDWSPRPSGKSAQRIIRDSAGRVGSFPT